MKWKKSITRIALGLVLLCVLCWPASILKCEILTAKHGGEFVDLWQLEPSIAEPAYLKVLSYSKTEASVYYVGANKQGGTVLRFSKSADTWILDGYGPYWSRTGSADDLIWPYIR